MFENKKVQKTVQKPEVSKPEMDKAVRDFEKNQDCDVLLAFVSEDIAIPSIASVILTLLTKMGDRPAIWIGEFYLDEDKVVHLKLVLGQVAQRQNKFKSGDEIVDYKNKADDLIQQLFNMTIKIDLMDKLLKLQKSCQREQNSSKIKK